MIYYILYSSIIWLLLIISYFLFFRKESFFQLNRFYLLISLITGLILPWIPHVLIDVPLIEEKDLPEFIFPTLSFSANSQINNNSFDIYTISKILYIVICSILFAHFLFNFYKILKLKRASSADAYYRGDIAFSFFNNLYIPEHLTSEEREIIITHEKEHINQGHSYDVIFVELLKIIYWFNPLIYWYKYLLTEVHEFQADHAVLQKFDINKYNQCLLSQKNMLTSPFIMSTFISSQLKSRIMMFTNTPSEKSQLLKYGLIFPILFILLLPKIKSQDFNFKYAKVDYENIDTLVIYDEQTQVETKKIVKSFYTYFKGADELPYWKSCESSKKEDRATCSQDQLFKFIMTNLKYPSTARDKGAEGIALIRFIVTEEGYLEDVEVAKSSYNEDLDVEAKNVIIATNGKWNPGRINGKAVNVEYKLPIKFKLNEKEK